MSRSTRPAIRKRSSRTARWLWRERRWPSAPDNAIAATGEKSEYTLQGSNVRNPAERYRYAILRRTYRDAELRRGLFAQGPSPGEPGPRADPLAGQQVGAAEL